MRIKSTILFLISIFSISACTSPDTQSDFIYWSDGDSGRIGDLEFRLANVDAPEIGPVGSFTGAKCQQERQLGHAAKSFMASLTNGKRPVVKKYGEDRYGRQIMVIEIDGQDISITGALAGFLKEWPHEGGKALTPKPDWC